MAASNKKNIRIFFCCADEDHDFVSLFEKHLAALKRRYNLTYLLESDVLAGSVKEEAIIEYLNTANIVCLLLSPDFIASEHCYDIEMPIALKRYAKGEMLVIPILLRPMDWRNLPFSHIQMLPANMQAINQWSNLDAAFFDVVAGIDKLIRGFLFLPRTREGWLERGDDLRDLEMPHGPLVAYEQAIRLDSFYASAHACRGAVLNELQHYDEALAALERAIRLDSNVNYGLVYLDLALVLEALGRFDEAQKALEKLNQSG